MRSLLLILLLFAIHVFSLLEPSKSLAGGWGDPLAHASMSSFYCEKVVTWKLHTGQFIAPGGVSLSNSYDSPFPMIMTCPFGSLGSQAQFHIFAALQVLLIVLSAWLVARHIFKTATWQVAYVLFGWWSGFYIARVHEHFTLLSGIWGFHIILWMWLTMRWNHLPRMLLYGGLVGLVFAGSFHNIAMLTMPLIILLGIRLWIDRKSLDKKAMVGVALASLSSAAVFGFLFGPSVIGLMTEELLRLPSNRALYNLDLTSIFVPFRENRLYDWLDMRTSISNERFNSIDWLILLLLTIALLHKRAWRGFWRQPLHIGLLVIAALSWLSSLGPEIRFMDNVLANNPVDGLLASIPPFSFSRTPARFAVVTSLCFVFLAFQYLDWRGWTQKKWLGPAMIVWILVTGPVLNREVFLPTLEYRPIFPMAAFEEIRTKSPTDTIVVNVPLALASDPSQNFMQLFHERRITSGYLAYVAYGPKVLEQMSRDPLIAQMNCEGDIFTYQNRGLPSDYQAVRSHLAKAKFGYLIVNKQLLGQERCGGLLTWVRGLASQPWTRTVEETPYFAVFTFEN